MPGDPLVFTLADGTTWTYRLDRAPRSSADDAIHIVDQTPARTATLFACHPKGSAAQRIVAHFTLDGGRPARPHRRDGAGCAIIARPCSNDS